MMAYADWAFHLAQAPGKQAELGVKAGRKWQRLLAHLMSSAMDPGAAPVIMPLPGDRRFADEAWAKPPFSWMSQAFLLQQQWLHNVTHEVPGVTKHHEDVVRHPVPDNANRVERNTGAICWPPAPAT